MYERFEAALALSPKGQAPGAPVPSPAAGPVTGFAELMSRLAGCTLEDGLYRILDAASGAKADRIARTFYPARAGRFAPFAMDWQGRIFAVDHGRLPGGEPQVMLLEPESVPLPADKCIGLIVPLSLGGTVDLGNCEISDWKVYWEISGQLKLGTANLPEGTPIRRVEGG